MEGHKRLVAWLSFGANLIGLWVWVVFVWPDFRPELERVLSGWL